MIRLLADEDFDNDILRALLRRIPEVDVLRVQAAGLSGAHDSEILAWAANDGRIVLTHDVSTMTRHALDRVRLEQPMPGVIAVHQRAGIGEVLDDLVLTVSCSAPDDLSQQILFVPLR
jgi:predicted nuclease of predicted toxin-antitoxin system